MKDNIRKNVMAALTVMMGFSLAPSAMADQILTVEEATGVPTVVGPGVVEYRTITRTTSTVAAPPAARVTVTNPVVIENKTTEQVTENIEEISHPVVYKKSAKKRAVARRAVSSPKVFRAVKTIERTVEKPVVVERPVLIDRPVDRIIERPVDRIIEKPVIIEKQVPVAQPVMIEKQVPVIINKPVVIEKKKNRHLLNLKVL